MLRELVDQLSPTLRHEALTHSSWAQERRQSYERLEFLGDAVLGLVIARELYRRFPDAAEGDLARLRAVVVSRADCAIVAQESGLDKMMLEHAPGETGSAVLTQLAERQSVLGALTESVIGAAFLELGYDAVEPVVVATFSDRIGHAIHNRTDHKTELQELAQRDGASVAYRVVGVEGPDHDRVFTVEARIEEQGSDDEQGQSAVGAGRSKKAAEQQAARGLLRLINDV